MFVPAAEVRGAEVVALRIPAFERFGGLVQSAEYADERFEGVAGDGVAWRERGEHRAAAEERFDVGAEAAREM